MEFLFAPISAVPAPEPPAPKLLGYLTLALALGTSLFGVGFWTSRDQGPSADQIQRAAARARELVKPGDLILLQPFYATRAREWLGDLQPVAPRDPLREDFDRFERILVFSLFDEGARFRKIADRLGLRSVASETPEKGVTIDLFANTSTRSTTYDFRSHLRDAKVSYVQEDGKVEPCDRWTEENGQGAPMGRWACRRDAEWFYVAPEWHRMGDHPRLCLWAHPPNAGSLAITFPSVPLGSRIHGRAGHTLNSSVNARERVDLDVRIDTVGHQTFKIALAETWRPFSLLTPAKTATVTFTVSSPDAGTNHFCFDARAER